MSPLPRQELGMRRGVVHSRGASDTLWPPLPSIFPERQRWQRAGDGNGTIPDLSDRPSQGISLLSGCTESGFLQRRRRRGATVWVLWKWLPELLPLEWNHRFSAPCGQSLSSCCSPALALSWHCAAHHSMSAVISRAPTQGHGPAGGL